MNEHILETTRLVQRRIGTPEFGTEETEEDAHALAAYTAKSWAVVKWAAHRPCSDWTYEGNPFGSYCDSDDRCFHCVARALVEQFGGGDE